MSDDLPLKVSDDASTQLSPRISPDDSVISIQQRIENLQAEEDRKIDSESGGSRTDEIGYLFYGGSREPG